MALDYSGQNLRGRSFRGKNLEGANFSGADIRSCDFTKANLRGANLSCVKAGLQRRRAIFLVIASFLLAVIPGFISVFASFWMAFHLTSDFTNQYDFHPVLLIFFIYLVFFVTTLCRGFVTGVLAAAVALVGVVTVAGVAAATVEGAGAGTRVGAVTGATVALIVAGVVAVAVAVAALVVPEAMAVAVLVVVATALVVAQVAIRVGAVGVDAAMGVRALAAALLAAAAVVGLSIYMACRALAGDEKYASFRSSAIALAAIGGTSFWKADLTDVNFQKATLKSTDFRNAQIYHTCWFQTQKLDCARLGESYLLNLQVQQLVITNNGQHKNFDRLNLCMVNFKTANLVDASFIGANLCSANLQDADLSRAKLVQTQLDGTDLTGATLTGACIEGWSITSNTKFDGVKCEYIFMRSPTPDDPNPHRKPDNWNETFAPGDFADFIKPIVDTLDLYHNSGVDPRAIAISFKQLAENHPEAELRIVGMEVKGEDKFLLRAKTALLADKSQLSAEYFTIYNELKALAHQEIKALVAEKDSRIASLETMVVTALQSPSFYAQTYNNQGDTMSSDRNINMGSGNYNERIEGDYIQGNSYGKRKHSSFNLQGAQFAGGLVDAETVTAHQIGGNITNNTQAARTETNNSAVKTILILASNPRTTSALRLDEEVREIDAGLQRAKKRELFDLKQRWAVRVQDVYQSLLDFKPQFVHFSGHGFGDDGLVLSDEAGSVRLVDTVALAGLFELFANTIECVVLNACYSEVQALAIAQHIPYVIGMNKAIGDLAAIKFATGFYSALGAGESIEFAYKLGCSVVQLDGIEEHLTPVLKNK